LICENRNSSKY